METSSLSALKFNINPNGGFLCENFQVAWWDTSGTTLLPEFCLLATPGQIDLVIKEEHSYFDASDSAQLYICITNLSFIKVWLYSKKNTLIASCFVKKYRNEVRLSYVELDDLSMESLWLKFGSPSSCLMNMYRRHIVKYDVYRLTMSTPGRSQVYLN